MTNGDLQKEKIPQGVLDLRGRFTRLFTDENRVKGLSVKTQSTDVICSNAHKAGTTWLLQIIHGLRSNGNMDFDELLLQCPGLEGALDYHYPDMNQPQAFQPRVFFTHMGYPFVPKGAGKYIFLMRDPYDSALSYYHYKCNWMFTPDEVSLDEFVEFIWLARGGNTSAVSWPSQIDHIASWYKHRLEENVLWLHYEDLKANLPKCVEIISSFLNVGQDDSGLKDLVVKQASLEFMKEHKVKFDAHMIKQARNAAMGLNPDAGKQDHCGRTRNGQCGAGKRELSPQAMNLIDEKWNAILEPLTGCKNYSDLRASINRELGRDF